MNTLKFLYENPLGRVILFALSSRRLSKLCGRFLDSRMSKCLIPYFIKKNNIELSLYEKEKYRSFNDCFTRRIKSDNRPIDMEKFDFISPCDGHLSVYNISNGLVIPVKQSYYTIKDLLENDELADKYKDGLCLVIRLAVDNYHRYCYVDNGVHGENVFIPGKLHTVRPIALRSKPVFVQNCREYTSIDTENFGTLIQMEVGAMLVGKIKNYYENHLCIRGEEKGKFLYGGSTIILLLEKDKLVLPEDYYRSADESVEIPIKMGEKIGRCKA